MGTFPTCQNVNFIQSPSTYSHTDTASPLYYNCLSPISDSVTASSSSTLFSTPSLVSNIHVPSVGRSDISQLEDQARLPTLIQSSNHEFELDTNPTVLSSATSINSTIVYGRLFDHIEKWRAIGSNNFVLDIIENGYSLPFTSIPARRIFQNNPNCQNHNVFIDSAISDLISSGAIVQVNDVSLLQICSPLNVAIGKKLRLIINLRYLNSHLATFKFKFEGVDTFVQLFEKDDFFINFDLKNAYHSFSVNVSKKCAKQSNNQFVFGVA